MNTPGSGQSAMAPTNQGWLNGPAIKQRLRQHSGPIALGMSGIGLAAVATTLDYLVCFDRDPYEKTLLMINGFLIPLGTFTVGAVFTKLIVDRKVRSTVTPTPTVFGNAPIAPPIPDEYCSRCSHCVPELSRSSSMDITESAQLYV